MPNYTNIPLHQGKVNKTQLLKRIIEDEMDEDGKLDTNKVIRIGERVLDSYPDKQTKGVVIDRKDVHRITSLVRESLMEDDAVDAPVDHGDWDATTSADEKVPTKGLFDSIESEEEVPANEIQEAVFSERQLLTASSLLSVCGDDMDKARAALVMAYLVITGPEGLGYDENQEANREGQARPATEPGPS